MMSNDIYKPSDFYKCHNKMMLKDGHTMFIEDVAKDLNDYRRGYLELKAELAEAKEEIEKTWHDAGGI